MSQPKKKFVAVGTGGRIPMFIDPIARDYSEHCEIAAFCDLSQVRMDYHKDRLAKDYGYQGEIRTYPGEDFDRMIDEVQPDTVIVCTTDALHHEFIIRSVEKGCNVICEKPITVDAEKSRAILEAVERTGKNVRVTFNVRWTPSAEKLRDLIKSGAIGNVKHVNMEYLLNTDHGADYFRRWHSEKASSGGLLVHKSTHHFDLVNWLIDSIPQTVYSLGGLVFYGKENAIARGDEKLTEYERYSETKAGEDPFYYDLDKIPSTHELYRKAEQETGYVRDRNVFREGIDIEDSMSVLVRYRSGVMLNYSLNAFCPEEGYRLHISGDKGRIEYVEYHQTHIIAGQSDAELAKQQGHQRKELKVMPLFGEGYIVEIPTATGGHGGGDTRLQEAMFSPTPPADEYARNAGHEQGIASALIGIAANQSIKTGQPVEVCTLVPLRADAVRLTEIQ